MLDGLLIALCLVAEIFAGCCLLQVMADAGLESSRLPGLFSEALVLKRKQRALMAKQR